MKGIRLYLVVLGILLAFSAYFLINRRSGSYSTAKTEFAVQDTSDVELVRISSHGETLTLSRTGGHWTLNGSNTREEAILGLAVLISRIEVEAPVSRALKERILEGLEEMSTEVTVGMKDGRDKNYLVYFDSLSGSTFMMFKESEDAFRVKVRGYQQSNLQSLFVCESRYWMDNIIFQFNPDDIFAINLQNNIEPGKSFHLVRNVAGEFEIARGIIPGSWSLPDKERLFQYLGYFLEVRFEAFSDPDSQDLYYREQADYSISVEGKEGEIRSLDLFPVYYSHESGEKQPDLNLLYGRIESMDEWIVIKYVQIDPLLQDFEYFK